MSKKILFVDDDPNVLAAIERQMRKKFSLEFALGGEQGLEAIRKNGPFAVIVADMRMPHMDGIQFLSRVKELSPDSVRMMLTGNADLETATNAINEGNIFRFLNKPCASERLEASLHAGMRQYQLITAERELLEKTLRGSLRVMAEILSMVNPMAFSRSTRIWRYERHTVMQMKLPQKWQFDLAAMLSQIGCITLPQDILDRIYAKRPITEEEEKMYRLHPSIGCKLLINIPRLNPTARMIEGQQKAFKDYPPLDTLAPEEKTVALGAQILKVAHDFDQLLIRSESQQDALSTLQSCRDEYNPDIVATLQNYQIYKADRKVKSVNLAELTIDMIADENIRTKNGLLLVPKGEEITYPVLVRLRNFSQEVGITEPIRVRVEEQEVEERSYRPELAVEEMS